MAIWEGPLSDDSTRSLDSSTDQFSISYHLSYILTVDLIHFIEPPWIF